MLFRSRKPKQKQMPGNDNYFVVQFISEFGIPLVVKPEHFFFRERDLGSTREAYVSAASLAGAAGGIVAMFRPPKVRGEWDQKANVVGHRSHADIMADCEETARQNDADGNLSAHEEMDMLSSRWRGLISPEEMH